MIRVVNISNHIPNVDEDIYIGRGSPLGNPFTGSKELSKTKALYQCDSREEAINNYREYLLERIANKDILICGELNRIYLKAIVGNVNLLCFCVPNSCHGFVIKEIIEAKIIKNKINMK